MSPNPPRPTCDRCNDDGVLVDHEGYEAPCDECDPQAELRRMVSARTAAGIDRALSAALSRPAPSQEAQNP